MGERAGVSGIFLSHAENMISMVMTGNCKSYFVRGGELNTLSIADSYELIAGDMNHNSTFPLSGLGLFDDLSFSTREFRPLAGDTLLLMTEGAYWGLSNREIENIFANEDLAMSDKVKMLISSANDKGNQRNQSVLLLQY
jgi:serine/threonine protein phosphatase PrpC